MPPRPARPHLAAERRLTPDERRAEILAAAAGLIDAQGFLPAPIEHIARAAGVSKALVYARFPDQADLCNALLARQLAPLADRIAVLKPSRLEPLALACARLYFDDVATHGVVLHTLLTDPFLDGERGPTLVARRDAIFRRLLRASRGYARLSLRQRTAALAIVLGIVEESGRLAHRGEMERDRAADLCGRLVLSALKGLRELK